MSRKRRPELFLKDILTAVERIKTYTNGLNFQEFSTNQMVIDAVIRNFEVIGEAVKKLPDEIKEKSPQVPWKEIAGFRDVLIHGYFSLSLKDIWATIEEDLEPLEVEVKKILNEMEKKG
jgi:uncharacterized protein with HEPN domain